MPYRVETIPVDSAFGVTIQNWLLLNDAPSGRLLALLPGRGYTNDHPVMYYLTKAALAQGYDVLGIEYGFQAANLSPSTLEPDKIAVLLQESQAAIEQALARGGYTHLGVAAKSMGTPMAVMMMPELDVPHKALILLTPIQNAAALTGEIRTLAIIGTADPSYDAAKIVTTPTLQWLVLEGLNHALEKGDDWRMSLAFLMQITGACADFLKV